MGTPQEIAKMVYRLASARRLAEEASRQAPDDLRAQFGAASAFRLTGAHDKALIHYERAAQLAPKNPMVLQELAVAQEYAGRTDAAIETYKRVLALPGDHYKAFYGLASLSKQTWAGNLVSKLEAEFDKPDAEGERSLYLGHALAKAYEDLGDVRASFDWLTRGKRTLAKRHPYSDERAQHFLSMAIETMRAPESATGGHSSAEPIFIVGLPRTGTTLVDRILSSHRDVVSAGELTNFAELERLLSPRPDMAELGRLYIESTRPLTGSKPRFTDKDPSNYNRAGLIHRALPNARIICLRRDRLDACLSNFRQIFSPADRYYDYSFTLEGTAKKCANFELLAEHWSKVLPASRYMEVRYEALVADQEAVTRALLSFCDLPWDENCLAFHENRTPVATPSAGQVRSKIYTSAVGRAQEYGELLEPAREVFRAALGRH